ncbi:MAG: TIGR00266 family protein [Candidatus Nitrospinota bacterium M3_3B_026]
MSDWYYATGSESKGPVSESEIQNMLSRGQIDGDTLLYGPGMMNWMKLKHLPKFGEAGAAPPPPPAPPSGQEAHEIDYKIEGEEMQYVEIELDPGESAVAEAGSMMYMSPSVKMSTVFGDGSGKSESGGFMDKLVGAGKRLITGESLFITVFTHTGGSGKEHVAFASPYPGKIIPMDLEEMGGQIICQKDAFLAAAKGVSIGIHFQKKIGVGLFGGEGFIMQKLEGDGMAFVHAGGTIFNKTLEPGEMLRVDTGCLVALEPSVDYDIEFVGEIKSAIFGGEGFFYATLRGPGRVWLQSLPFSRLAGRVHQARPTATGGGGKGEGSLLDAMGGLGGLMRGD